MGLCSSASKVLSSDRNEGTITFAELKGKSRQEKIKTVFDFLDANNNGVITLDEFMTTASRLTNSLNLDIGWWFPGSDSSLDKVVIDGIEYINSDTGTLPRIMAVNLFITLNSKAVFN